MFWNRKPCAPKASTVPMVTVQIAPPPDWTLADSMSLRTYLNSIPGKKLRQIISYDMCTSSVMTGRKNKYEQGVVGGMAHCLSVLRQLSNVDEARESADE